MPWYEVTYTLRAEVQAASPDEADEKAMLVTEVQEPEIDIIEIDD